MRKRERRAAAITAGETADGFHGEGQARVRHGADQGAGTEDVAGKAERFRHAGFILPVIVGAQNNKSQLTGQGELKHIKRHALIIGDNVAMFAADGAGKSQSVLGFGPVHGGKLFPVQAGTVRKFGEGAHENAGDAV